MATNMHRTISQVTKQSLIRSFNTTSSRLSQNYYLAKAHNSNDLLRLGFTKSKQLVGALSSRGTREKNEDEWSAVTLELPAGKNLRTMDRTSNRAYFGIFDGHGGPAVSEWLANSLHERIETVSLDDLPELLKRLRAFGGYFKRFKIPGIFKNLVDQEGRRLSGVTDTDMSVEQRIMLGFLMSDVYCIDSLLKTDGKQQEHEGSTGSIAIVEPHDDRAFWESQRYDIIVGHVGDTRILVCESCSGEAVALTTGDHHPGNPLEQERLRKLAGYVTTDSWGDDRILGLLATSRAFGDSKLKRYGVSSEPDIVRHTIDSKNPAAFMVLVTDGVTSVMSDQEVVDIVKQYKDPTTSAKHIVDICDQFGSEDNITAVVVRLKDWGARMNDLTLDLRKYRLANSPMSSRQSW